MQVCTYYECVFSSGRAAFEAFKNVGRSDALWEEAKGLQLGRAMGVGGGNGFSIWPDFKRYAFIMLWDSEEHARDYFCSSKAMLWYRQHASEYLHFVLRPTRAQGAWGGVQPFDQQQAMDSEGPLVVLTRATIRAARLLEFWKHVPRTSRFMSEAEGVMHRVGIGEYPLFMQATVSMWESRKALMNAAYKNTVHADIVKLTRERNWYSEELFAQFEVIGSQASGAHYAEVPTIGEGFFGA